MKRYIRTENGVYYNNNEKIVNFGGVRVYLGKNDFNNTTYERIIKEADTIEELCDEFVLKTTSKESGKSYYGLYYYSDIKRFKVKEGFKGVWYGAIWTDKGLIYVAKMNDEGCLELL